MVHSFTSNFQKAAFDRTGKPDIATQQQNFRIPLELSLISLARPLLSRWIQLKTGVCDGANAGGGIMHQTGSGQQ